MCSYFSDGCACAFSSAVGCSTTGGWLCSGLRSFCCAWVVGSFWGWASGSGWGRAEACGVALNSGWSWGAELRCLGGAGLAGCAGGVCWAPRPPGLGFPWLADWGCCVVGVGLWLESLAEALGVDFGSGLGLWGSTRPPNFSTRNTLWYYHTFAVERGYWKSLNLSLYFFTVVCEILSLKPSDKNSRHSLKSTLVKGGSKSCEMKTHKAGGDTILQYCRYIISHALEAMQCGAHMLWGYRWRGCDQPISLLNDSPPQ